MDDLRAELDNLEPDRLEYVYQRSKVLSDKAAYEAVGISRSKFYTWSVEERDHLNELANAVRRDRHLRVEMILGDKLEQAAHELVRMATDQADSDTVKLNAIKEVFNRLLGKVSDKIEHTGAGGGPVKGYVSFDPSAWDDEDAADE